MRGAGHVHAIAAAMHCTALIIVPAHLRGLQLAAMLHSYGNLYEDIRKARAHCTQSSSWESQSMWTLSKGN
jgi:hypothetical protein